MSEHYTIGQRLRRWFKVGIIPVFFPVIAAILFDVYLEYTFKQIVARHLPDLMLVAFAISISVLSTSLDVTRNILPKKRESYIWSSAAIGLISFSAYAFFYDKLGTEASTFTIIIAIIFVILSVRITVIGYEYEKTAK